MVEAPPPPELGAAPAVEGAPAAKLGVPPTVWAPPVPAGAAPAAPLWLLLEPAPALPPLKPGESSPPQAVAPRVASTKGMATANFADVFGADLISIA
jgi:hypothetical protein